jgi:hypothetical protein
MSRADDRLDRELVRVDGEPFPAIQTTHYADDDAILLHLTETDYVCARFLTAGAVVEVELPYREPVTARFDRLQLEETTLVLYFTVVEGAIPDDNAASGCGAGADRDPWYGVDDDGGGPE